MRRAISALLAALMLFLCSFPASADENSFRLTESTMSIFGTDLVYMKDQQMFHFTGAGEASVELSAEKALYFYIIAGSDHSNSNGVTDNGVNSGCSVTLECLDGNGERVMPVYPALQVPADHKFHRYSIGSDTMYAGLPDDVKKVRVTFTAQDSRQYIRAMEIRSSASAARDMSLTEWETHDLNNINAETTKADYWIMVGCVSAVAIAMMIFAKMRNNMKKGK